MFFDPTAKGARLALLTLPVVGDDRPRPEQPKLKEGVHLRWAFARDPDPTLDRGFPWYGFYLFRRLTLTGGTGTVCASSQLAGMVPGSVGSSLTIPLGTFSSQYFVVLTDDFSPAGSVEFDLSNSATTFTDPYEILRFEADPTQPLRSIHLQFGFVADFPPLDPGGGTPGGGTPGDGTPGDETPGGGVAPGSGGLGDDGGPGDVGPGEGDTGIDDGGLGDGPSGGDGTATPPGGGGTVPPGGGGTVPPGGGWDPPGGTVGTPSGTGTEVGGDGALTSGGGSGFGCACGCHRVRLVPIAVRVVMTAPGQYRATFGYLNTGGTFSLPIGAENRFFPDPAARGQPVTFYHGVRKGVFAVVFDGKPITWRLAGRTITVSAADAVVESSIGTSGIGTSGIGTSGTGTSGTGTSGTGTSGTGTSGTGTSGTGTSGTGTSGTGTSGTGTSGTGASGTGTSGTGTSGIIDGIIVTVFREGALVTRRIVSGHAGEIVSVPIATTAADEIRITNGPARLINLCVARTTDGLGANWEPVPNLVQPVCLPVRHPDYPCNAGSPNEPASRALAFSRVSYGDVARWSKGEFLDLHEALSELVETGPSKGITDHVETITADVDPTDPSAQLPKIANQSWLDLVLRASIDPAMAQMLGLYWVDDTAVVGQSYDYLLLADNTNAAGGSLSGAQALANAEDYSSIDGCAAYGVVHSVTPPLGAPAKASAYALPVGAIPPSVPGDAAGLVGLTWDVPLMDGAKKLPPNSAFLFHIWRAALGTLTSDGPTYAADDSLHQRITDTPFAPSQALLGPQGPRLSGWPSVPLFGIDGPLQDGWYGYKIGGIDIFGRYSALSPAAVWLPTSGNTVVNDFAVRLKDTTPPPPPTRVQAWVLDPGDPSLIKDAGYNSWPAAFHSSVGLRVSWVWTGLHMRQAPDLREFRVYFNVGTALPSSLDGWSDRIAVVAPNEHVTERLLSLVRPNGTKVEGTGATVSGTSVTLGGADSLEGIPIDGYELELTDATGRTAFNILELDVEARTLKVDPAPSVTGSSRWRIAIRERTYELFLPNTGLPYTLPLTPSLTQPVLYALVGVSAADHETTALDQFERGALADRYGNESTIGGPVTVYRVNRAIPKPTSLAAFPGARLLATRADFNSLSYFTLHYSRVPDLYVHAFRAMDEALFAVDALKGFSGTPRAAELNALEAIPEWSDPARRQSAITEINTKLHQLSDYASLSDDALRLLASLPSNSEAFTRLSRIPLGIIDPGTGMPSDPDVLGKNDSPDVSSPYYYAPDSTARGSFEDILDGRARNRYFYRAAAIDNAQNMSGLGMSTPPVYLPENRPPRTPLLIGATGGDRSVSLAVVATDPAIDNYQVYRATSAAAAQDIRTMQAIVTYIDARPAGSRNAPFTITDAPVVAYQDYFYRVSAVTTVTAAVPESRESFATPPLTARAFDGSPPPEPTWERSEWVKLDPAGAEHAISETDPNLVAVIAVRLVYASDTVARVLPQSLVGSKPRVTSSWAKPTPDGAGNVRVDAYLRGLDPSTVQTLRARAINRGGIESISATNEVPAP